MKHALIVLLLCCGLIGCTVADPGAGSEAVMVRKPVFFGHGGVDPDPVKTGRSYFALSTDAIYVNMQPQRYDLEFDNLMTSDGVPITFDAQIILQVTDSVRLVKNFGPRWYEINIQPEFSNRVRQAVRRHGLNETAISTEAIDAIKAEIWDSMTAYIGKVGMPVRMPDPGIIIGKASPPDSVRNQRIETAAQQQRQHTEEQRTLAENARKAAETARAAADNAYRIAMGMSPEQFVQLENINMQEKVCSRGGCTFFIGGGSPIIGPKP